jgi:hypothetical protein
MQIEGLNPQEAAMGEVPAQVNVPGGKAAVSLDAKGMTLTSTECITAKNPVPNLSTQGCAAPVVQKNGNTLAYQVTCGGQAPMSIDGQMTFSGNTLQGVAHTRQTGSGQHVNSTAQISGAYMGPCQ